MAKRKAGAQPAQEAHRDGLQAAFLEGFARVGTVTGAAILAKTDRSNHYTWLDVDPTYLKRFDDAKEVFKDRIRHEVRRRALTGWQEPVVYQGRFSVLEDEVTDPESGEKKIRRRVLTVRKFSDRLLEKFAMANCEEFREKHEVSGSGGGPVQIQVITGVPQPDGQ